MIFGIIAIILILAAVGICLYCFNACFYSANQGPHDPYGPLYGEQFIALKEQILASTKRMEKVAYEPVEIKSFDGLTLCGRYYHVKDGAPVKIIFHGYRSFALRDAAGGFCMAQKLGMNVLAVDMRAHGNSEGHVITFGIWERRDCHSWIKYVNERFGKETPIILSGLSMGAATVVMAATLPMPNNVCCILADSPYSSPGAIIKQVCQDSHIPSRLAYPFIRAAARFLGGFNLEQCDAMMGAEVSSVPILLLHGEEDRLVPCSMSKEIDDASENATTVVTFPDAGHGLSYLVHPVAYEKAVFDFLRQIPALEEYIPQNEEEAK